MYNNIINDLRKHGYKLENSVGSGGYAKCFSVMTEKYPDVVFVCKCIFLKAEEIASKTYFAEIEALTHVIHPYIVQIYDYFHEDNIFYLILENCPGGSVDKLIRREPLHGIRLHKYIKMAISAVEYLHKNRIAHHDLKPGNFLVDQYDRLKLTDFGFAKRYDHGSLSTVTLGSLAFAAPDIFEYKEYDPFKADVWSLGVCFYQFATGKLPFVGKDHSDLIETIRKAKYSIPDIVDSFTLQIITLCLNKDPKSRPDIFTISTLISSKAETQPTLRTRPIKFNPPLLSACKASTLFKGRGSTLSNVGSQVTFQHKSTIGKISHNPAQDNILKESARTILY